ncbi:MAG: TolC family protein [Gammaproteobacteria bacterium]|nr:TolC family protein [Gammaproteobacteria bacterium]
MEGMKSHLLLLVLLITTAWGTAFGSGHSGAAVSAQELTLAEAIRLVLRNNRTLIEARLVRDTQKFSLEVAEDEYRPKASIDVFAATDDEDRDTADITPQVNFDIPSGGQFTLKWSKPLDGESDRSGRWTLGFSQPLLKGAGTQVDTASLRIARISERIHFLSFQDTVAGVIELVIHAYRAVIRANQSIRISRAALQRAKEQLEINRLLIQAGRLAANEIIQTEAEVADRELELVENQNALVSANSALIDLLDMEQAPLIEPSELPAVREVRPDLEQSIETALLNRRDHRRALHALEIEKINQLVAEDGLLWDLTLDANLVRDASEPDGNTDYSMGLQLKIPLWREPLKLSVLQARTAVRQAEMDLAESRQGIQIEVRQAVHDVEVGFLQTKLAIRSRELAQRKLDIEKEKLAEGLTSTFRLTSIEDDLVRAQNAELNTSLSYLRALTELDRVLGVTLERWGIAVERFDPL